MLLAKLIVVPLIIAAVSFATRKWGAFIGGLLSGFPIVAGPITFFLALEQGEVFAINAAHSTLLGISALSSFCFTYAWSSMRFHWAISIIFGWACFFVTAYGISLITLNPILALGVVVSVIAIQFSCLPKLEKVTSKIVISNGEIVVRMLVAIALVMSVTYFAKTVGPQLSGVFAVFPVAASVLTVFTHKSYSQAHVSLLTKGLLIGILSLTTFYFSLSVLSSKISFYLAFLLSIGIVCIFQIITYKPIRKFQNQ